MILDNLVRYTQTLVNSATIKYTRQAKNKETLDSLRNADLYCMAVKEMDSFNDYLEFPIDALVLTYYDKDTASYKSYSGLLEAPEYATPEPGTTTKYHSALYEFARNPSTIPMKYRDGILKAQRILIKDEFVETNDYYRMLNGQAPIDYSPSDMIKLTEQQLKDHEIFKEDYKRVDSWTGEEIIPKNIYVTMLNDTDVYRIINSGLLDELKEKYPNEKYLWYLGTNKIDIVQARDTLNFGILSIDKEDVPESIYDTFLSCYEVSREYFTTTLYNYDFSEKYDMYDNFVGLCIMLMAIQKLVSSVFESGIKHDFYDWEFIQNLYKMYNVPFIDSLSMDYHVTLLKNLNNLLRYKSTDKVLFDVCSLLGYERMNIYKYYLVKKHKLNEKEEPVFAYKEETNTYIDEDGNEKTDTYLVEDYEKMYELYFQAVNINERNTVLAMQDDTKRYSYNEIVSDDPYWWETQDLIKAKYEEEYNYLETKYLDLTLMYKMTEMLFEITYAFSMLIDKKDELSKFMITIPKIVSDTKFNIFDVIVFMIALLCKSHGFAGNVTRKPTQIADIVGFEFTNDTVAGINNVITQINHNDEYTESWEPYEMLHNYGFNFDTDTSAVSKKLDDNLKSVRRRNSYYSNRNKFDEKNATYTENTQYIKNHFSDLSIDSAEEANDLFERIRHYNNYIIDAMRNSTNIEEYRIYKDIFNVSMISETQDKMFTYKDGDGNSVVANKYIEYLEHVAPALADVVKSTDKEDIATLVEHILSQINGFMESLEYLYIINEANNPVHTALVSLIRFFKSYTTDLVSVNIVYLFDSKYYNLIKFIADVDHIHADIKLPHDIGLHYADKVKFTEVINDIKERYNRWFDIHNQFTNIIIGSNSNYENEKDNLPIYENDRYNMISLFYNNDTLMQSYSDSVETMSVTENRNDNMSMKEKLFVILEE